ncbi:putative ribonuclease H-like domain-containing protein [Tanacetum coccineum]
MSRIHIITTNTMDLHIKKFHPLGTDICLSLLEEPKTISQALKDESWVEAMQEELLQFKLQKVWVLVDLPYRKKEEGIDYDEVFTPVARIEAIRLFLAFASYMGFTVYQMDVKSAFLYGTIEEEVYVHQPLGFVDLAHPNKVYKVIKALYGLHQAPRAWYETLSSFLMENGFRREFEDCMHKRFQMSSMGELTFFLGLQVKQQPDGIFISQDKYVADILKKFDFLSIRTATTPIESNKPLVKDEDGVDVDVHVYRSMIDSLMYLTASRLDIMFAICACARFQVTLKASHLNAVKRIFRYLKHQPKLGLWYPRDSPFELEAYSDSDYGGASLDRKSTTGGCQFLDCYEKRLIEVIKIHTDSNVADLLTKGFDVTRFNFLVDFQDSPDDEEDTRSSHEYLNDLEEEYQERTLLAKSKRILSLKAYEWDEEGIDTSNDNEMVEVKVLMALAEENDANSKKGAKNGEWVKICMRKSPNYPNYSHSTTKDEGAVSERPSETQPIPSPTHPSEDQFEPQPDPFLRPSFLNLIPNSIPEGCGGNHGGQSSSDRSQSGTKDNLTLQSMYDLCVSLCKQVTTQAANIKDLKAQIKQLKKKARPGRKTFKSVPTMHKDPSFDDLADAMDYIEIEDAHDEGTVKDSEETKVSTEDKVSTDKLKVSTDKPNKGTAEPNEGTAEPKDGNSDESAAPTTVFRDDETIAQFLPLPKIDPKDKGKKVLEEKAESDAESKGVNETEKKFKMLANNKEIARKVQEEWEAEEEKKKLAEEEATKTAFTNEYDFIQARLNADKILVEKLQEEER